jgi:hypothetical protein
MSKTAQSARKITTVIDSCKFVLRRTFGYKDWELALCESFPSLVDESDSRIHPSELLQFIPCIK